MEQTKSSQFGLLEIGISGCFLLALLVFVWAFYLDSEAATLKNQKIPEQKENLEKTRRLIQHIRNVKARAPKEADRQEQILSRLENHIVKVLGEVGVKNPGSVVKNRSRVTEREMDDQPYIEGGLRVEVQDVSLFHLVDALYQLESSIPVLKTYNIQLNSIKMNEKSNMMMVERGNIEVHYYKPSKK